MKNHNMKKRREIMKIVIDPGHGGSDRANRGPTGYIEADGVLDIALRLEEVLLKLGYEVLLTRDKDETVELYRRSEIANQWQGQLFLSLHTNAGESSANGIETFYSFNGEWGKVFSDEAKRVAEIIQRRLTRSTGLRDRGIKTRLITSTTSTIYGKDYYAVIRRSRMPAIITELGFHSNPDEEALLKTAGFRQEIADVMAKGIQEAYPPEIEDGSTKIEKKEIKLSIHGRTGTIEGFLIDGSHFIPVRFLEGFGYEITWDEQNAVVEIEYRRKTDLDK